jgi:hypothetical protein
MEIVNGNASGRPEGGPPTGRSGALAARFAGRGRWRERLPKILDMLVALGRAHVHEGTYVARA